MMNTAIQFGDSISHSYWRNSMYINEIDPLDNDPSTDDGTSVRQQPQVPSQEDVTPDLYYPENAEGPDPSEEEQRDRSNKEKINTEEDQHKEQPDHSEENIYDADPDQKKEQKNSLN
ncbi:hypothetical protein ACR784_19425 [Sphingobacterium multivorum]|uniref:Uncharacterized protein n=2 Tax=Sphingobacterium TaxID=28453 RepID=A0ACD5C333_9SPHI